MTTGTDVKLTKLKAFEPDRPRIFPTGYWSKGIMRGDVRVGATIIAYRYERAGLVGEPAVVECNGIYVSSPVLTICPQPNGSQLITTQNSHWLLEPIL